MILNDVGLPIKKAVNNEGLRPEKYCVEIVKNKNAT